MRGSATEHPKPSFQRKRPIGMGRLGVSECARRTHSFGMLCPWMGALQIQ